MRETGEGAREDRRGVNARLAEEAEVRWTPRTPPVAARWVGWALCAALAVAVVVAAVWVDVPW